VSHEEGIRRGIAQVFATPTFAANDQSFDGSAAEFQNISLPS
jgi:hypothetical protein